jgi:serine protease Do
MSGRCNRLIILLIALTALTTATAAQDGLELLRLLQDAFAAVAERAAQSVVYIEVTSRIDETEEFYYEFWGWENPEEIRGAGSGFIIDAEGYIMTNAHVVADAEEIQVTLADERKYEAELVGADIDSDVALIRLTDFDGGSLPVAELGDSDAIRVGDWVLAIGSPFGLQHSVTQGIISATGRNNLGLANYEDFIQTDASINPGNSGGPLVNLDGRVIGINSAIRAGGGFGESHSIGVGFAIPINMAVRIARDLREEGAVTRGWLGVSIQDVSAEMAEALDLVEVRGALVAELFPESPALEAGLMIGDVILALEEAPIRDANDLKNRVAVLEVGEKAEFLVNRDGRELSIEVEIGRRPEDLQTYYESLESGAVESYRVENLGLTVQDLTEELAEELELSDTSGALVTQIDRDGPAYVAGIRRGDVVLQYDRMEVVDAEDFRGMARRTAEGEPVLVLIWRDGRTVFLAVEP